MNRHKYSQASLNLAARECVQQLCLDPERTLSTLLDDNLRNEIKNINNYEDEDLVRKTAFSILKNYFEKLKTEICRVDFGQKIDEKSSVMRYLKQNSDETLSDVLLRYVNENELKSGRMLLRNARRSSWREINVYSTAENAERRPVPANVPPLDPIQVEQCLDEPTPPRSTGRRNTVQKSASPLKVISDEMISSSEESSLSDQTEEAARQLRQLSQQVAADVIQSTRSVATLLASPTRRKLKSSLPHAVRESADKCCGTTPRSELNFNNNKNGLISNDLDEKAAQPLRFSKEIQTSFEVPKVDVATEIGDIPAEFLPRDNSRGESASLATSALGSLRIAENVSHSSFSTTLTTTSSSELSTGQIPLRKAVLLLESSQHRLITVNVDGSMESHSCPHDDSLQTSNRNYSFIQPISRRNASQSSPSSSSPSLNVASKNASHRARDVTRFGVDSPQRIQHPGETIDAGRVTQFSARPPGFIMAEFDETETIKHYGIPLSSDENDVYFKSQATALNMANENLLAASHSSKNDTRNTQLSSSFVGRNGEKAVFSSPMLRNSSRLTNVHTSTPQNRQSMGMFQDRYRQPVYNDDLAGSNTMFVDNSIKKATAITKPHSRRIFKARNNSSPFQQHQHSSSSSSFLSNAPKNELRRQDSGSGREGEDSTLNQISPIPTSG